MDALAVGLFLLLVTCLTAGGLHGLHLGDRYRACRGHRWQRAGTGGLRCERCGWVAGSVAPSEWFGEGP